MKKISSVNTLLRICIDVTVKEFYILQNDCIRLIGLDSSDLEEAKNKINQFLADKLTCTRNIQCKRKHVKKFILTHLAPPNLKLSAIEPGLAVSGNSDEVDSCK